MKKLLATWLAMVMGVMLLTGCGGEEEGTAGSNDVKDTLAESSAVTDETGDGVATEQVSAPIVQVTAGQGTVYETDNVKVTMSAVDRNDPRTSITWGGQIKLIIENKTEVKTSFNLDSLWINGYEIGEYFAGDFYEVESGKATEEVVELPLIMLEQIGIENVGELKMKFRIRNREQGDYLEDVILGYQTEDYANMDTSMALDFANVGEAGGLKISAAYVKDGNYLKDAFLFLVENTSDRCLAITFSDLVQGEKTDFSFWPTGIVHAGEQMIFQAPYIHGSAASEERLAKGDALKMKVRVKDYYTGEVLVEDTDTELSFIVK